MTLNIAPGQVSDEMIARVLRGPDMSRGPNLQNIPRRRDHK